MRTSTCLSSLAILLATGSLVCTTAWAVDASKAVPVPASNWAATGAGATYNPAGGTAAKPVGSVVLNNNATVLNWNSFNIGKDATVQFQMPSSTARVLNNVNSSVLTPTQIDGMLNANGQVYIYDPRGIVFGKGSQVNVNSLVASSLRVDPDRFLNGILVPSLNPIFAMDPALGFVPGAVVVQGDANGGALQRAAITAQQNGFILLVAPQVQNAGDLKAPDGQVVLASGSKVYLAAPNDSAMRGFRVEVSNEGLRDLEASASNAVGASIDVQRGNATLVGMAVNQMGTVSATTSVNLNGSIYLKAQGAAVVGEVTTDPYGVSAKKGGALVLGAKSQTQVDPLLTDTSTATVAPAFKPSQVLLTGNSVVLEGNGGEGARIRSAGGQVTVTAQRDDLFKAATVVGGSRIEMQPGSSIDVSGSAIQMSMESNVFSAELRGAELADNPLLRNSVLRGQKIYLDSRQALAAAGLNPADLTSLDTVGSSALIADTRGYLKLIERNVGQNTTRGGSVNFKSDGSVTIAQGSAINVSGGWVDYQTGNVNTTKLTLGGKLYDVQTAPADLAYDGAVLLPNSSQNQELGYRQGASAGTLTITAPLAIAIDPRATLLGATQAGIRQRDVTAADAPRGGKIVVGDSLRDKGGVVNELALDEAVWQFTGSYAAGIFDLNGWAKAGFGDITVRTKQGIDLSPALMLNPAGSLTLGSLENITIASGVQGAGASVVADAPFGSVTLGSELSFAKVDLAGRWTNDSGWVNPSRDTAGFLSTPIATKGGSFTATANLVKIHAGATVDVSGGAWLGADGKLSAGAAGSITLASAPLPSVTTGLDGGIDLAPGVAGEGFLGYGLSKGGTLTLKARNVWLGDAAPSTGFNPARDLLLAASFFQQGGFTSYTVGASGNLTVEANTVLQPQAKSWVFPANSLLNASGPVQGLATTALLDLAGPLGARPAASIALIAGGTKLVKDDAIGVLRVESGARISTDPGATVTLQAVQALSLDGAVRAPGGRIDVLLSADASYTGDLEIDPKIWMGSAAVLDASGTADRTWVDARGLSQGAMLAGGAVLFGNRDSKGVVVATTGAIEIAPGATVNVSGASAVGRRVVDGSLISPTQTLVSDAGNITITTSNRLLVAGNMVGQPGGDTARSGSLQIELKGSDKDLQLGSAAANTLWLAGLNFGDVQSSAAYQSLSGMGLVNTPSFASGGFGKLLFSSAESITLASGLSLEASNSIRLDAPVLRALSASADAAMRIAAPSVTIGLASKDVNQTPRLPSGSGGMGQVSLAVSAQTIDLLGNSVTQGFNDVRLEATGDVRLQSVVGSNDAGPYVAGSFLTGKNLDILAAQVYPTTLSQFTLATNGTETTLTVRKSGELGEVLSAGGTLTLKADTITQAGRLLAPFGQIHLIANTLVEYAAGSLTSVAGAGTVPFGLVSNGNDWSYTFNNVGAVTNKGSVTFAAGPQAGADSQQPPAKLISTEAPTVMQASATLTNPAAVLDLGGGGALYGFGVSLGPGGSKDILSVSEDLSKGKAPATFAINPKFRGLTAPLDANYGSDGLQIGDRIYLSASAALPAGFYTLLPAHYALLDGGMAVLLSNVSASAQDNRLNADGSYTVAGARSSSTDGRGDTRLSAFKLLTGTEVRRRTEFQDYNADKFFTDQATALGVRAPELPRDAGQLSFQVSRQLDLAGQSLLQGNSATGNRGHAGLVDISAIAQDIGATGFTVTADASTEVSGTVRLLADQLNALGADSLLIGGRRTQAADGMHLEVDASSVRIDNNRAHPLQGLELLLVAHDVVEVTGRSSLAAQSMADRGGDAVAQTAVDLSLVGTDADGVTYGKGAQADGALLRLSSAGNIDIVRDTPLGATGRLLVRSGALLSGSGSMGLDATRNMSFQPSINLAPGSAFSARTRGINLGAVSSPDTTPGLTLNNATLAKLNKLSKLDLASYSTMTSYGNVTVGSNSMQELRLQAGSFKSDGGNLALKGQSLALSGLSAASVAPNASGGAGQLSILAGKTLVLGDGSLRFQGFASTDVSAAQSILLTGKDLQLTVDNALTLHSPLITANPGTVARITSGAAMVLDSAPGVADAALGSGLGATLEFSTLTRGMTVNTTILAKGGQISLTGAQGVVLNSATLDVSGVAVDMGTLTVSGKPMAFGSGMAYAPAGSIQIDAGQGNLTLAQASVLDLSATGADAGDLVLRATGPSAVVNLGGVLRGVAVAGVGSTLADNPAANPLQASFSLDAASALAQFDALNAALDANGFTRSRTVRVRNGDLVLGAGGTITARTIALSTDNGNLTIDGTLDARGPSGGVIDLYAASAESALSSKSAGKLALTGATLMANANQAASSAAGSLGDGGRVTLGVSNTGSGVGASLSLDASTRITTLGEDPGSKGELRLRAPVVANTDVAVSAFAASVQTGALILEAVQAYDVAGGRTLGSSDVAVYKDRASTFIDHEDRFQTIQSRLANSRAPALQVQPGVEVRTSGDLTVSVNEQNQDPSKRGWDLSAWRFGSAQVPGTLTLRASGNLTVSGSISDGFSADGTKPMPLWTLRNDDSWSMRLIAGGDLASAAPLATLRVNELNGASGNFNLTFARDGSFDDAPLAMLRTGTGRIDVVAARNLQLDSKVLFDDSDPPVPTTFGASIYTAGKRFTPESGFDVPTSAVFGKSGGGISLRAGGDVVGVAAVQTVNSWLLRQGRTEINSSGETVFAKDAAGASMNTAWWTRPDLLGAGVATLGGGDIAITAVRGSVLDLTASVATNAYVQAQDGMASANGILREQGGGDLVVRAGKSIAGGQFYVQKGRLVLRATEAIGAGKPTLSETVTETLPDGVTTVDRTYVYALRPLLALGDAVAQINAGGNVEIDTVYNPTLTLQSAQKTLGGQNQATVGDYEKPSVNDFNAQGSQYSSFVTYGQTSGVYMTSLGGDVALGANSGRAYQMAATALGVNALGLSPLFALTPPTVSIAALSGSTAIQGAFVMAPAPLGSLDIYARKDVNFQNITPVVMLDNDPAMLSSVTAPSVPAKNGKTYWNSPLLNWDVPDGIQQRLALLSSHTSQGLHADDPAPARVVALEGSVNGSAAAVTTDIKGSVIIPKSLEVLAGQDITDFGFVAQNLTANDVTRVVAVRDITMNGGIDITQKLSGPGVLLINAGRTIDLGESAGVVTRGNLDNVYLPSGGAAIEAVAGTLLSKEFMDRPAAQTEADNASLFTDMATAYTHAVKDGKTEAQALQAFDKAIAKQFDSSPVGPGNILSYGSQFKTEQGGSVDLWAPGGSVIAGLEVASNNPASNGIFTVRGGAIRSFVGQDFVVNQGRVFTLGGGDITLVSQFGNIDAGKGAKTAASAPPPLLKTDANGNTTLDLAGSIAGSGIATLRTSDTQVSSNVVALAPRGIFDAGDAGVRSTGKVQIEAAVVLNANNIAASGGVSGSVAVASAGAVAPPSADTASAATQSAAKQSSAPAAPTLALTVDVLGYGDVSAAPGKDDAQDDDADETDANGQKKRKSTKKP